MEGIVKIQEIQINNFKNVKHGVASFQSYNYIKKKEEYNSADILGIYGQNGSGKTSLVESIDILKTLLIGNELDKNLINLFMYGSNTTSFKYTFLIEIYNKKYLVKYSFELRYDENKKIEVSSETLKYSEVNSDKRLSNSTIICYNSDEKNNMVFTPLRIYSEIAKDEKMRTDILVAKELSKINRSSFVFNKKIIEAFKITYTTESIYYKIINSLYSFALYDLFVINNNYLGFINLNQLMPFSFMIEDSEGLAGGKFNIKLFEPSTLSEQLYDILQNVTNQINIVLESIVPGLNLGIKTLKEELQENGETGVTVELLSIRGDVKIPLKYESEGIKKVISILSALIAMYNNEKVCVVIDELDAGVFEFLLGELLTVLKENSKGQLIFTSHNLRALEVLDKNDILFTTTNEENRYIRFKNVKKTNNLRDFYLRCIFLGGQDEEIYKKTKKYSINRAFRKAGKRNE